MIYQLLHGDCLELLPTLAPASVDSIIADPPYGTTSCAWDSVIPLPLMWEQLQRVLRPGGAIVLFGTQPFTTLLISSNLKQFKHALVWDKVNHANFAAAKVEPLRVHEDILVFCAGKTPYTPQLHAGAMAPFGKRTTSVSAHHGVKPDNGVRSVGYPKSIIRFPKPNNLSGGGLHPTQKSLELMRYLVRTYTTPGTTVLDFTMGSGTTGAAALLEGRNFIGIELVQDFFDIAVCRCAAATTQLRLFENDGMTEMT